MAHALAAPFTLTKLSKEDDRDQTMQEFLLCFTPHTNSAKLLDAVHALYYLPSNFKLVITDRDMAESDPVTKWAMQNIMDRILFADEKETKHASTSLFSYADAIIADATTDPAFAHVITPLLVVSDDTDVEIAYNERHGFNVPAGNPEAMASAAMRLARARM
jgi:hypothetical protein